MPRVCDPTFLTKALKKPQAGGYGLPDWIEAYVKKHPKCTEQMIFNAIQAATLNDFPHLNAQQLQELQTLDQEDMTYIVEWIVKQEGLQVRKYENHVKDPGVTYD